MTDGFGRAEAAAYWRRLHAAAAPGREEDPDLLAAVCYAGAPRWLNRRAARLQRRAFEALLRRVGDLRGLDALEVGCGTGRWARLLGERGARVTGVDLSSEVVEENRRRLPDIRFVAGDFLEVPLGEESFDLAVTVTVLQHLPPGAQDEAVARLGRLVRPGGHALVLENTRDVGAHVFGKSAADWVRAFERAGFRLVANRAYGYDLPLQALGLLRRRPAAPPPPAAMADRALGRARSLPKRAARALVLRPLVVLSSLLEPLSAAVLPDRLAGHGAFLFERRTA